ncbi:MAG TPA: BamA/TamA family outer membrane protein [Polyangiaceae bacterium]|nr:BamA/TamA family outer membrane protein [Polyangiaceae bacterium]
MLRGLFSMRVRVVAAISIFVLSTATRSRAQSVRTWGAEPDRPAAPPAPASAAQPPAPATPPPASTVAEPASSTPPPAPPPATVGTPVPGSTSGAATPPSADASAGGLRVTTAAGAIGLKYVLEGVEVRGNRTTLSRVVLRYVPFRPGDVLDVNDRELELTRFRLLGTGFFRDVQLSLRRGTRRGAVVLVVDVIERNTFVVDSLWLGLSKDVGTNGNAKPLTAYGGAQVTETNLAGTGIALGGAFAVADGQLGLRVRLMDPQFLRSTWTTEIELLYNNARDFFGNGDVLVDPSQVTQDYAVAQYTRFGGRVGIGHDLGISSQVFFDYRLEKIDATLPLAASDYRGLDIEPIDFMLPSGSSVLSTVRATLVNDTRDDPFLTTRGHYLLSSLDASLTPFGSDYAYAKIVLKGSQWFALPWAGHVIKVDALAEAIFGNAPLFERFYVGDLSDLLPDRVLDLNFDRRPAPNFLDTDIVEIRYGNYAAKLDAEYRIPLYRGTRSIYGADFFGSVGVYGLCNEQDLVDPARGYSGFATVPIDLTFNAGLRIDTQAGTFVIGIANLVGLIPIRGQNAGAVGP